MGVPLSKGFARGTGTNKAIRTQDPLSTSGCRAADAQLPENRLAYLPADKARKSDFPLEAVPYTRGLRTRGSSLG